MTSPEPTSGPFKLSVASEKPKPPEGSPRWLALGVLGLGIFLGSFWLLFGFLSILGTKVWWQYAVAVVPGAAILFLALMARRAPLPFGAALAAAGLLPLGLAWLRHGAWLGALLLGLPLMAVGAAFILLRDHFAPPPAGEKAVER